MNINSVKTPTQFSEEIEELVWSLDVSYWDAILLYIEKNGIEIETVASLVKQNSSMKAKLAHECQNLNLLEKAAKLLT